MNGPAHVPAAAATAVEDRVAKTIREEILATTSYATAKPAGMIELHANENPWPLPASLRGELAAALAEAAVNRYPEGAGEGVKRALAAALPIPASEGSEDDIVAFVQPVAGESPTEAEIRDHARAVMPKYMVPKHIRFVDALPITPTNKVEKYKLKQQIAKELGL